MSWLKDPRLRPLLLAALALRVTLAVVTEVRPLFPAYYYTDARMIDRNAVAIAQAWRQGASPRHVGAPNERLRAALLGAIYYVAGYRPLIVKLLHACAATAAIAALFAVMQPVFGPGPALGAAALTALWPSHAFFTSQNFKDAFVMLLCYGALAGFLAAGSGSTRGLVRTFFCLVGLGLLRIHVMAVASAALALTALAAFFGRRSRQAALLALATALAAPVAHRVLAWALFLGPLRAPNQAAEEQKVALGLVPSIFDQNEGRFIKPLSPEAIARTRFLRQSSDRDFSRRQVGRDVATQLFYGLELKNWADVAAFLPKGLFYVLFMPLPGLYPLAGNVGRQLAAAENLVLLFLACAALWGFARWKKNLAGLGLLAFFAAMAVGSALLEFDLGSATRHRLLYMPLLWPLAWLAILPRKRNRREGRQKVLEVVECGGPGGTGNQVAAICNGLDRGVFDVGLIFSTRDGDAQAYRAAAPSVGALHVPEMQREIDCLRDLRALRRLRRIFAEQKPDVVHAHSSKAGFLARLAAWSTGVPRIFYSPHGYSFLQADRPPWSRAFYRALEWSVSWIGEVVAVSPSEAALARPLTWGKPVHTVSDPYLGALPAPAARPDDRKELLVGACGRLTAARNPDAFVALSQRLADSRNDLRCVWIGGGEDEARVRRHLENMNLTAKVEVTGWLGRQEALARLSRCDLMVHYSRWDALPNAVLEAMALGLPVVCSDAPGCRDVVVHEQTGFVARNEMELLEYSLKLVDDPELRRRLGEAGQRRVRENFGLAEALRRLQALYLS